VKNEEKILKEKRNKHKSVQMLLITDISSATLQARRPWHEIFTVLKGEKTHKNNKIRKKLLI
jgi:hypothetical protein